MSHKVRQQRGITLLELVVAIGIAALVSGIGLPAMGELMLNQRLNHEVSRLHLDLSHARASAITKAGHIVACPREGQECGHHSDWHHGWLLFQDLNRDREYQPGEPLLRTADSMNRLTAVSSASRSRIRFYANGTAPGSAGSITFCDKRGAARAKALTVSNTGRIRARSAVHHQVTLNCG